MRKNLYILLSSIIVLLFSLTSYAQPVFTLGPSQTIGICENSPVTFIDSRLSVSDAHTGTTDTWSIAVAPAHGTASVSYTATSTGSTLTPTLAQTYSVTPGYVGNDSLKVRVTDGTTSDTITVYVIVHPAPSPIIGSSSICIGAATALSDTLSGGTWASSNTAVATIGLSNGVITGMTTGSATITYMSGFGCTVSKPVTVVTAPAPVTGAATVCAGYITAFSDATGGGTWSSSNTVVATVSVSGFITGVSGGTAVITYIAGSGCATSKPITVYPTAPITGGTPIMCPGDVVTLTDAISGGTWSSSNTGVAVVSGGMVAGVSGGTAYITYTYTTGCISFRLATVNPTPAAISGVPRVCIGGTTTLSDASSGGTWTSDNTAIATIDTFTGYVSGIAVGPANITYTFTTTGCAISVPFTVNPLPAQYPITGGGNYCSADSGIHVYLGLSDPATSYFLHTGPTTIGPFFGSGSMLDFGLQTIAGTYTAFATNTATGCSNIMTSSITITVTPSVPVSVNISSSVGDSICTGTLVSFNANPLNEGTIPFYQWQVNGVNVGTDAPSYAYTPAPGDVVTALLAADTLCATADSVIDTYSVNIITPVAPSVSLAASPSNIICMGSPVTITPTPFLGGKAPVYIYYIGGVPIGAGSKLVYVPSDSDVVNCLMISNYFCRSEDSAYAPIQIYVPPVVIPFFNIDAYPSVLTAPGQTVTFTAIVTNGTGPYTYQWTLNDSIITGATSDTFTTSNLTYMGNDSISCEVTEYNACHLTSFNWRKMENNVGVKQLTSDSYIDVLPNPSNGNFTIKGTLGNRNDEDASLEVTNMMGQIIYRKNVTVHNGLINEQIMLRGTVPNGMYVLSMKSAGGNRVFHLVINN